MVERLITTDEIVVVRPAEEILYLSTVVLDEAVKNERMFEPYWTRSLEKGHTLGNTFIEPFKEYIKRMVE